MAQSIQKRLIDQNLEYTTGLLPVASRRLVLALLVYGLLDYQMRSTSRIPIQLLAPVIQPCSHDWALEMTSRDDRSFTALSDSNFRRKAAVYNASAAQDYSFFSACKTFQWPSTDSTTKNPGPSYVIPLETPTESLELSETMSIDLVHPVFMQKTSECIIDRALYIIPYASSSRSQKELHDLQDSVISEMANSALCAQFGKFSRDQGRTCVDSEFWCVSSGDTADSDELVELGAFGKFNLRVKPDEGGIQ